jgi:hypothetical protein
MGRIPPKCSVPHPFAFFLANGWDTLITIRPVDQKLGAPLSPRSCSCGIGVPGERFLLTGVI